MNHHKRLSVAALTAIAFSTGNAEATYYRFWRGEARTDISQSAFLDGLNESLFPATGDLARTAAQLTSYVPVTFAPTWGDAAFPEEVAIIGYKDEAGYQAYRSTPEGKAYGDLHWPIFEKSLSRSLVPGPYAGQPSIEAAYDVMGREVDWNDGVGYFHLIERDSSLSDADYLTAVTTHVERVQSFGPQAYVVLVAANAVYEYLLWDPAQFPWSPGIDAPSVDGIGTVRQFTELNTGTRVSGWESGIVYPVGPNFGP